MTRILSPLLAAGIAALSISAGSVGYGAAQQPPAAPEPKMPPMPSMEGQQGDVSKPVTQIPPRKKPAAEKKTTLTKAPPKAASPANARTKR